MDSILKTCFIRLCAHACVFCNSPVDQAPVRFWRVIGRAVRHVIHLEVAHSSRTTDLADLPGKIHRVLWVKRLYRLLALSTAFIVLHDDRAASSLASIAGSGLETIARLPS